MDAVFRAVIIYLLLFVIFALPASARCPKSPHLIFC
jgi:hypothetical protein